MVNELEVRYLSNDEIRVQADLFLSRYHPSKTIPIPIEEIVEFQMGIHICGLPGLHRFFEIDGFTSSDMSIIHVDQHVYESRPGRFRFTLAHEVGHIFLHRHVYQRANFGKIQEWMDFINSIPENIYSTLEYQAYAFAGLLLVPSEHLKGLTDKYIEFIRSEGISLEKNWDSVWERIAAKLAKAFEVSSAVVEKRLGKDNIAETYRPSSPGDDES